jgi:tRNA A-37 threonylcarbamoyl transferase component Bud32
MYEYVNPKWEKLLHKNRLIDFESFWSLPNDWFEPLNTRRNGWSGVITKKVGEDLFFVKKQENHNFKSIRHPILGQPTFLREFQNIQYLIDHKIPTLEVIFFGIRDNQCVLVTRDLNKNNQSLQKIIEKKKLFSKTDLNRIAKTLGNMHKHNVQHTYPVPKHIYLNKVNEDIVLIDLEKMKKRFFSFQASIRDLYAFLKYAREYMDEQDISYFLRKYFKNQKPNILQKFILRRVNKKIKKL